MRLLRGQVSTWQTAPDGYGYGYGYGDGYGDGYGYGEDVVTP